MKDKKVKKKKIDVKIWVIILLLIVLIVMYCFYIKKTNSITKVTNNQEISRNANMKQMETKNKVIASSNGEIISGLTENLELHATYYLEEVYVKTNQLIKKGENILKYTNGTYLTAPYDCVITQINIPSEGEKCTNEHYIEISSNNILKVKVKIDESKINLITLGQNAIVEVSSYEDKKIEGNITNISNTASNGKFTVTIEFENDGEVMIGMSALVTIKE